MKVVSTASELMTLRNICGGKPEIAGTLMSLLSVDHFHNEFTKETYGRVVQYTSQNGSVPTWKLLLEDPELSEKVRLRLKDAQPEKLKSVEEATKAVAVLDKYRKLRGMFELAEEITVSLRKGSVDVEELLNDTAAKLVNLRQNKAIQNDVLVFGKGNNSTQFVKDMLNPETPDYLPTGFNDFDKENGGIGFGNLVSIAGTTGGGKSTLASQLGLNWAGMGEDITIVPLEMSKKEMTARLMANAASIDLRKILFARMSDGEKKKYWGAYKKWVINLKGNQGSFRIFKPKTDMTIQEIMACIYPFGSRVVIIDYISLLGGVDGDNAWQKLGEVARYSKVYAEANNIIVVLLCQLSDEGVIRYARSIAEHCVVGSTLVDTPEGLRRIDSFVEGHVRGPNELTTTVISEGKSVKTSAFHFNGTKKVFDLVTRNGMSIRATNTHKFLCVNKDTLELEWKPLKNVNVGDHVAVSTKSVWPKSLIRLPEFDTTREHHNIVPKLPRVLTPELGRYIGGMLSDGYIGKYQLDYVTIGTQSELVYEMERCFVKEFGNVCKVVNKTTPNGTHIMRLVGHSVVIKRWLLTTFDGLVGGSKNKFIPSLIMQSPKSVAAACVRGMFDGDATFSGTSFWLASYSPKMLKTAQLLLLKFGINSTRRSYKLCIEKAEDQLRFLNEIGLDCIDKKEKLTKFARRAGCGSQTSIIPGLKDYLLSKRTHKYGQDKAQTLIMKMGVGQHESMQVHKSRLTRQVIKDLEYIDPGLSHRVKELSKRTWSTVVSVDYAGTEKVYDLTVPDTASFVADGFVVHNSNYSWKFVANKTTRENGVMNIEQLKARNGRLYDFTLKTVPEFMQVMDLDLDAVSKSRGEKDDKSESGGSKKKGAVKDYLKDLSDEDSD